MKIINTTLSLLIFCTLTTISIAQSASLSWAKQMGSTGFDSGQSIISDANGNVYTVGVFSGTVDFDPNTGIVNLTSAGDFDVFIQKLDISGNLVWAKKIGGLLGDQGFSLTLDPNDNILITGTFQGTTDFDPGVGVVNLTSNGSNDIFILKLNNNGDLIWVKKTGGTSDDEGKTIATDILGNVYTAGYFAGTVDFDPGAGFSNLVSNGGNDIFVQKLDINGDFVWAKTMGGTAFDLAETIDTDTQGNVYVAGNFESTVDFDPGASISNLTAIGPSDLFILKLDSIGNFIWAKKIGGSGFDQVRSMFVENNGNVYTTGRFEGTVDFNPGTGTSNLVSSGGADAFVLKMDGSGTFLWAKRMGGTGFDFGRTISADAAGNVYSSGRFNGIVDIDPNTGVTNFSSIGSSDVYIQKLSSSGVFIWAKQLGGTGSDLLQSLYVGSNNTLLTTGFFQSTVDFDPNAGTFNLTSTGSFDIFVQRLIECTPTFSTDTQTACSNFTWIDGNTYSANNNSATFVMNNSANCDSIITLNLTILSNSNTDTISACDSITWIDGNTYTSNNNTASFLLTNSNGCDSLVTLDFTVLSTSSTDVLATCDSLIWIDGLTYTSNNNIATFTLPNAAGCDSIVTLDLTILNSTSSTDVITACESYEWIDGITYTSSNNSATFTLPNSDGCDSIITLNLTINSVSDITTTTNGVTITANNTNGTSYQWLDCDNGFSIISGAINVSYVATTNGNYAVQITENGCTDTSDCAIINDVGLGLQDNSFLNETSVFPNPTNEELSISFKSTQQKITLKIFSSSGQILETKKYENIESIDLNLKQSSGVYFLELENQENFKSVFRIVKN